MSTTARQCRAAVVAALTLAGGALSGVPAVADPSGGNGVVEIHEEFAPDTGKDDDSAFCRFSLDAVDFGPGENVNWAIAFEAPSSGGVARTGSLALPTGAGSTEVISLADGHYRLTWVTGSGQGADRHRTFWVACPSDGGNRGPGGGEDGGENSGDGDRSGRPGDGGDADNSVPVGDGGSDSGVGNGGPGAGNSGPNGGPQAGGGGLAKTDAFSPVAGAALVGLTAVTGAVWLRLRRRPHGAA